MKFEENKTIEPKKSTSELKDAVISICAMLDQHGKGTVYFGIADDGTVFGRQIGKSTIQDISKENIFKFNKSGPPCHQILRGAIK